MFADDIESRIHSIDGHEAEELLTPHLDAISKWSKIWRIKFSPEKSPFINFTRKRRPQTDPLLFLNGRRIPQSNEVKHLEIHFDKGLRWIKQTEVAISKAIKIQNLLKVLSKSKHGPSLDSLCILYKSLMRSRLECGLTIYGSSSKRRREKLETVQNNILRIILNALRTTPIKEMQCELNIVPLDTRRTWLAGSSSSEQKNSKTPKCTHDAGTLEERPRHGKT